MVSPADETYASKCDRELKKRTMYSERLQWPYHTPLTAKWAIARYLILEHMHLVILGIHLLLEKLMLQSLFRTNAFVRIQFKAPFQELYR